MLFSRFCEWCAIVWLCLVPLLVLLTFLRCRRIERRLDELADDWFDDEDDDDDPEKGQSRGPLSTDPLAMGRKAYMQKKIREMQNEVQLHDDHKE